MDPAVLEASRVRGAIIENRLQASYIGPQPPHRRVVSASHLRFSSKKCDPEKCSSGEGRSLLSAPSQPKPSTGTQPDFQSIYYPARPLYGPSGLASASPRPRHHSPSPETQEKVAAASKKTLTRLRKARQASLVYGGEVYPSPLGKWQLLALGSASSPTLRRAVTSVASPVHSEFAAAGASSAALAEARAGAEKPGQSLLRLRLRRGRSGLAPVPPVSGRKKVSPAEKESHPLQLLIFLGSTVFDSSPIGTVLPCLSLRVPPCPGDSREELSQEKTPLWQALNVRMRPRTRVRRDSSRAEMYSVHLGDTEARSYRVEVRHGEVSPLESLLKAYPECVWDGSEFFLIPLTDRQGQSIQAFPSASPQAASVRVRDTDKDSGRLAAGDSVAHYRLEREKAEDSALPDIVSALLRSADGSFSGAGSGGTSLTTPSLDLLESASMGGLASGLNSAGSLALKNIRFPIDCAVSAPPPALPRWKRFCTTAALYLTLGEAGCCDVACFPYVGVRLCGWNELLGQQQVRIEAKVNGVEAVLNESIKRMHSARTRDVPVAVLLPMSRKGLMRRPWSLTTQPFTDGEVFQLFYLQLLFRAYFDVRFRGMTFTLPGQQVPHLRSDLVAVRSSGNHHVAFEHPLDRHEWLLFPASTRLLTLLNLEEAVVPLYATPAELQETSSLPLFGAGETLPCIGDVGCSVARWASTVEVSSPEKALSVLVSLFERMKGQFRCTRGELWRRTTGGVDAGASTFTPLLFRCGELTAGAVLHRTSAALSRFFVSTSKGASAPTAVSVKSTDGELPVDTTSVTDTKLCDPLLSRTPKEDSASTSGPREPPFSHSLLSRTEIRREPETTEAVKGFLDEFDAREMHAKARQGYSTAEKNIRVVNTFDAASTKPSEEALGSSKNIQFVHFSDGIAGTRTARSSNIADALVPTAAASQGKEAARPKVSELPISADNSHLDADGVIPPGHQSMNASSLGPSSLPTAQGSLATRWRHYVQTGDCALFNGSTADLEFLQLLGRGGSSLVFRGTYSSRRYPVAVKVFFIPEGLNQEQYVREALIDVAFHVLVNRLEDLKMCKGGRAHDFIVSEKMPKGFSAEAANEVRRGADGADTKLCYLVTDLMDGTLGRFLTESDADFDPLCDQLLNSPLCDGELFQFLFFQLAIKALFDWKVLDLILTNQLRGDNIGYRYVAVPPARAAPLRQGPEEVGSPSESRQYYAGILYSFQFESNEPVQYLRFPADTGDVDHAGPAPLRFIHVIDLGQGTQPNVAELVRKHYVGETVLESCIMDDGLGRYWPLDELYCRGVDVEGSLAKSVVLWGSALRVATQNDAFHAMRELFENFYPTFGVEAPTDEELQTYLRLSWTPANTGDQKALCVYETD